MAKGYLKITKYSTTQNNPNANITKWFAMAGVMIWSRPGRHCVTFINRVGCIKSHYTI